MSPFVVVIVLPVLGAGIVRPDILPRDFWESAFVVAGSRRSNMAAC